MSIFCFCGVGIRYFSVSVCDDVQEFLSRKLFQRLVFKVFIGVYLYIVTWLFLVFSFFQRFGLIFVIFNFFQRLKVTWCGLNFYYKLYYEIVRWLKFQVNKDVVISQGFRDFFSGVESAGQIFLSSVGFLCMDLFLFYGLGN